MCFRQFRLSSIQHSKQYEHLQALSGFLQTIFPLPDPTNPEAHEQSTDPTSPRLPFLSEEMIHHLLAFHDGRLVHDFIEMYYALQDSHSVTSLALYCLQKVSYSCFKICLVAANNRVFIVLCEGCENVGRDNAISIGNHSA
jgi:hypothetical protein